MNKYYHHTKMRYYMAMGAFITLLLSGALALLAQSLHQAYFHLPARELKRRSSHSKPVYRDLAQVARYDAAARILLKGLVFVFGVVTVFVISRTFDPLLALVMIAVFAGLLKAAETKPIEQTMNLAAKIAPQLSWLLRYLEPVFEAVTALINNKRRPRIKTDIYDAEDLKEFIQRQRMAINNKINEADLERALHALDSGGHTINDRMVPRSKIHFVTAKDPIGPILLSELHKTGYKCFPVKGNGENEIVGMLHLDELTGRVEGGVVADAMDRYVFYVLEDNPLEQVAQAFVQTGRHVFMVVNSKQEIAGLITLNDLLKELLGREMRSEFDEYDDPAAVAAEQQGKNN